MTRYLPPHLRDKLSHAGEAAANGEARGLDGLQQPYEAKVGTLPAPPPPWLQSLQGCPIGLCQRHIDRHRR